MDPAALVAVALAAVLHAAWNVLLKTAGDPLRTATAGVIAASIVVVPLVALGWLVARPAIPVEAWGIGLVSGTVEVAYFVFLAAAYRRGDLSVVYPLARGSAPLLAVAIGVLVLGERLSPGAWLGVSLLIAGLLVVQRPWRLLRSATARDDRLAAGFALLTGAMIASYTALDRVGVQLAPAWFYAGILWPVCAVGLAAVALVRPRIAGGALRRAGRAPGPATGRRRRAADVQRLRPRALRAEPGAARDRRAAPGVGGRADVRLGRRPPRRGGGPAGSHIPPHGLRARPHRGGRARDRALTGTRPQGVPARIVRRIGPSGFTIGVAREPPPLAHDIVPDWDR